MDTLPHPLQNERERCWVLSDGNAYSRTDVVTWHFSGTDIPEQLLRLRMQLANELWRMVKEKSDALKS